MKTEIIDVRDRVALLYSEDPKVWTVASKAGLKKAGIYEKNGKLFASQFMGPVDAVKDVLTLALARS